LDAEVYCQLHAANEEFLHQDQSAAVSPFLARPIVRLLQNGNTGVDAEHQEDRPDDCERIAQRADFPVRS